MSIRIKVILPYLILTLLVAVIGVYVVTQLVTSTLSERLTNQLLEAGRVVSDEMTRLEQKHLDAARIIAFTRGVAEAIHEENSSTLNNLARPVIGGLGIENVIIVDASGKEILHAQRQADGSIKNAAGDSLHSEFKIIQSMLASKNAESIPMRQFSMDTTDGRQYYFSAIPVALNGELVGMVLVGTSLNTLMPNLKNTSLADVTFHKENGVAIASTFAAHTTDLQGISDFSIPADRYNLILYSKNVVFGEVVENQFDKRTYSIARGPLVVANDRIGVFSVALPTNFVTQASATSRNTYVAIFIIAVIFVILIGYFIARLIINPLYKLVQTSQAIIKGDLGQRTGIKSTDEIGMLATTFDSMTESLQERTNELQRTNRVLENMDRTKGNFIQISAHELRTPLTLVQGYAQMLEIRSKLDPELNPLAKGILEGSDRMQGVVNSMLDISRIDSNTLNLSITNQQLHLVIAKVMNNFKSALADRKITSKVEGLNLLPLVPADTDLLYKVFYNLVENAIKYTPDGGYITIRGRVILVNNEPDEVELSIQDTGVGIDPQNHALVFEKFYQTGEVLLHSSGKTKFKGGGPGLGLAIARGVVEAHNGRIWVESPGYDETANPGSTFFVRLLLHKQGK